MPKEHPFLRLALHAWPFPNGAGRLTDLFFPRVSFREEVAYIPTKAGFSLYVWPNDLIGRQLYLTGRFDSGVTDALTKVARRGDVLVDVGANIGLVSAWFLNRIAQSSIVAIEPQPHVAELLRKNLERFGDRSSIHQIALSDHNGNGWLEPCELNSGAARIVSHADLSKIPVHLQCADEFFSTLPRADLIKIDVEGHERQILSSAQNEIRRLRPRAIIFEDHTRTEPANGLIGTILRSCGYSIFAIKKRLTGIDFKPVHYSSDCMSGDYIALYSAQN